MSDFKPRESGDVVTEDQVMRSGMKLLYPGSHEFRPVALIRLESPLAPEGYLVVVSFEKTQPPASALGASQTPEQTLELLSEAASAFSDQVAQSKEVLAKLGHHTRSTQRPAAPRQS